MYNANTVAYNDTAVPAADSNPMEQNAVHSEPEVNENEFDEIDLSSAGNPPNPGNAGDLETEIGKAVPPSVLWLIKDDVRLPLSDSSLRKQRSKLIDPIKENALSGPEREIRGEQFDSFMNRGPFKTSQPLSVVKHARAVIRQLFAYAELRRSGQNLGFAAVNRNNLRHRISVGYPHVLQAYRAKTRSRQRFWDGLSLLSGRLRAKTLTSRGVMAKNQRK